MKNKIIISVFVFIFFVSFQVIAQKHKLSKVPVTSMGEAEIAEGDKYYELQGGAFKIALEHYLRAYVTDGYDPNLNFKIGICYLSTIDRIQAIPYFQKAFKIKPNIGRDIHLLLGLSYQLNLQWDEAIKEYRQYKLSQMDDIALPTEALQKVSEQIAKKIEECENGKVLMKHPVNVKIENLGNTINTVFSEYSPFIIADESVMYFTSRRENTTGKGLDEYDLEFYEDIYYTEKKNGIWVAAKNIGSPINTEFHESVAGISADGHRVFIYKGSNGGDLYECRLEGERLTLPVNLGKPINTKHHESTVCLSYDEKTLFFVSDKPKKSIGGRDIYKSTLLKNGKWGKPENLGTNINTIYDEDGIFMLPDGKTLYFSSQGHNTMGGYDIFKSVWDESTNRWSTPENMGYPINTPDDDVFLSISASGNHAYFSSVKNEGKGEKDLYMLTFSDSERISMLPAGRPVVDDENLLATLDNGVGTTQLTIFKGIITDSQTGNPVEAEIRITDILKNISIAEFKSNISSGKFLIALPSGRNYGIVVNANTYLFHSENFELPASLLYREVNKDIALNKLEAGSVIVLNNIFFDHDKAILRDESKSELEIVFNMLKANPEMVIEISGHTSITGSAVYNKKLSEARAQVVVDYLHLKSIDRKRMVFIGYGATKPLASNETTAGKRQNRRTELKILSK